MLTCSRRRLTAGGEGVEATDSRIKAAVRTGAPSVSSAGSAGSSGRAVALRVNTADQRPLSSRTQNVASASAWSESTVNSTRLAIAPTRPRSATWSSRSARASNGLIAWIAPNASRPAGLSISSVVVAGLASAPGPVSGR